MSEELLKFEYDPAQDILTIEGIKYSGGLFRGLGISPSHPDEVMRIVKREDDVLAVSICRSAVVRKCFDEEQDNAGRVYMDSIPLAEFFSGGPKRRYFVGLGSGLRSEITQAEAFQCCASACFLNLK